MPNPIAKSNRIRRPNNPIQKSNPTRRPNSIKLTNVCQLSIVATGLPAVTALTAVAF